MLSALKGIEKIKFLSSDTMTYKMKAISSTKSKSMAMWGEPHTEGKNCDK